MLKKYSPIATLEKFSKATARSLNNLSGKLAIICDTDGEAAVRFFVFFLQGIYRFTLNFCGVYDILMIDLFYKRGLMYGWLIVNSFIDQEKFHSLYAFLKNAAEKNGVRLEMKTGEDLLCEIHSDFKREALPDFVLFWDKDIYLAKRLETQGLRLFNSANAVEICDNKVLTSLCLKGKVPLPKTVIAPKTFEGVNYCKKDFLRKSIELLGLPLIIKEAYGSFGQQVYLASTYAEAEKIVGGLGYKEFLMQEYVRSSHGRDVRVNVVGGKVASAMLRYNENDFRSNISNGGSMRPISLTREQEEVAIKACKAIGLDFAGVDILFGEQDEPVVCEVNSNPHFESSFRCTGVDMSVDIIEYIKGCLT